MPFPEPQQIVFAGDWHGNTTAASSALWRALAVDATVLIQLGDFGLWPGNGGAYFLSEVNAMADQTGVNILWLDGNHEDFPQLYTYPVDKQTGLRQMGNHLFHLPRGIRWEWNGVEFLTVGGATSLDKGMRRPGTSWWPEEEITEQDYAEAVTGGRTDVLLMHDCPSGVNIPGIHHRLPVGSWPLVELERAWNHRDLSAGIAKAVEPTNLWHGHFHVGYRTLVQLTDANLTRVVGLADDAAPLPERTDTVDLAELAVEVALARRSAA